MSGFYSQTRPCDLQNAKRRAKQIPASPVSTIRFTDRKSPKFAYLPTAYAETLPSPPPNRAFVLPSRYGMAIVEIRGVAQRIPTQSCVQLKFHPRDVRQRRAREVN